MHNNYASDSTVYELIFRFNREAINKAKEYEPNAGDVWIADETVLKIAGQKVWFCDGIELNFGSETSIYQPKT